MSNPVKVKVMWGKQLFEDVAVDMQESPMVFKRKIAELTNVEPERQKILLKAGALGDDDWGKCKVKKNQTVMMMGTASDKIMKAPTTKTLFIENQPDQGRSAKKLLPYGLPNLGNTCYMNSTLQCIHQITPLEDSMKKADPKSFGNSVYNLMKLMGVEAKTPMTETLMAMSVEEVWTTLKAQKPNFAERTPKGHPAQQDADECWGEFVRSFESVDKQHVRAEMGITVEETLTCKESDEEPAKTSQREETQLSYPTDKSGHVFGALKELLTEEIEKKSEVLGRNAVFTKKLGIARLPHFLVLKGIRFQWHAENQRKILRPVKYTMNLDMYDMCTDELKEKVTPMRNRIREATGIRTERDLSMKNAKLEDKKEGEANAAPMDIEKVAVSSSFEDDAGSNNNGYYNLVAVLSHQGRSADSGHYVAWCRQKATGSWLKFDDDKVSEVTEEQVLELCGGRPDAHIGYLMIYEAQTPDLS